MATKNERAQLQATNTPSVHTDKSTTKKPQWQVVLEELQAHKEDGITSWDMITRHHITRTAAHICTIKKMGYGIESKYETNNGTTYSRYWLTLDLDEAWNEFARLLAGEEDEEEDEDDDDEEYCGTDYNALAEEIFEVTGRWESPESLRAEREQEAFWEWKYTRGW